MRAKSKATKKWNRGQYETWQDSDLSSLSCSLWKDTKPVRFISTFANVNVNAQIQRRVGGRIVPLQSPHVQTLYGQFMSGVDAFDKLRAHAIYGKIGRKSVRNWLPLWYFIVNSCITNAWILYKSGSTRQHKKRFGHFDFRHQLALQLINGYSSRQRLPRQPLPPANGQGHGNHSLIRMNCSRPKRCYAHPRFKPNGRSRYDTVYGCGTCGIHLCPDCNFLFHQQNA